MVLFGNGISLNYDKINDLEKQLKDIKQDIQKKSDDSYVREKHKKLKKKAQADLEDTKKLLEKSILDGDKRIADQIKDFEERIQDLQKKTLWKI